MVRTRILSGLRGALLLWLPAIALAGACRELPGLDQLLAKPGLEYLVVADVHGTNEAPAFFADVACHAGSASQPVVVALEWPVTANAALLDYMRPAGNEEEARRALLTALGQGRLDGRGSHAMFSLLREARREN